MSFRKIIVGVAGLLFLAGQVKAQDPMGLYFMETIPQTKHTNPVMQPRANGFFALPNVNQLFQSDLAFSDVFQDVGSEWVSPLSKRFNYGDLYKTTGKAFNINQQADVQLVGLGFRSERDYISVSLSMKGAVAMGVPSDLFRITDKGLSNGSRFDFSTLRTRMVTYKEINIGYSREWTENLTLGINVKPLFGVMGGMTDISRFDCSTLRTKMVVYKVINIGYSREWTADLTLGHNAKPLFGVMGGMSDISRFELQTSREAYNVYVDRKLYTSAPLEVEESETPGDFPESIEGRDMDDEWGSYFSSFKNPGIALDLGAVYRLNDRLQLSAALTNLGFIKWKEDLNSLSFSGHYSFEGLEVDGSNKDDLDEALEAIGDSLETVIDYSTGKESFSMSLVPGLYVGAQYDLTRSLSLGLLSRSLMQKQNFRQEFNLSANWQPYTFLALNANYGYRVKGGGGLGGGLSLLLGPLQFFAIADYLPTHYGNVNFEGDEFTMFPNQRELSVKLGFNLIFGRHGYRNRPMLTPASL